MIIPLIKIQMRKHYETIQFRGIMQITPIKIKPRINTQTAHTSNLLTII